MYKLMQFATPTQTTPTHVQRLIDGAVIPFDPDNTDYQAYLKWLEAGNQPLPADTGA